MLTGKNKKLLFMAVLTTALLLAITSIAMAYVATDQADYTPGSTVTISGDNRDEAGYLAGETVQVDVAGPNGYEASCEAVADGEGAWSCQVTLWADDLAVGEYSYTATGQTSGVSEDGTFTDDAAVNINFATNGLPALTSVSVDYQGTNNGGNTVNGPSIFDAPGPSSAIGLKGGSTVKCTFPSSITVGSSTYNLSSQPCGSDGYTLPPSSTPAPTITLTGVYTLAAPSDTTPPVITYVLDPSEADGFNGWYKSNVTLTWTVTENESPGSLVKIGCVDQNITSDQVATTYSCSATSDGGTAETVSVTIKRDSTAPNVTLTPDRDPDSNGWYNALVTFTVSGEDATSDNVVCDDPIDYSGPDSATANVTGYCTDEAGNKGSATAEFKYDATAPTITITLPVNGGSYSLNEPVASNYACSDITSGIASCNGPVDSGENFDTSAVGPNYFKVTATDKAGNTNSLTHTYYVNYIFDGFFAPVNNPDTVNSAKSGQAIPIKWRLTDFYGNPVDSMGNWSVIARLTGTCGSGPVDTIETYAGSSGWQYLGDGYWQFNWKTPKSYAGLCLTMTLDLGDGVSTHIALFKFK